MSLPLGFARLAFVDSGGFPQTVPFPVGPHRVRVTLVVLVADLPALLSTDHTEVLLDLAADAHVRPASTPTDHGAHYRGASPGSLTSAVVRPYLYVRDGDELVTSRPAVAGRALACSVSGARRVELWVDKLRITAGNLRQPGELGSVITIGVRAADQGRDRLDLPTPLEEEDPYGLLA